MHGQSSIAFYWFVSSISTSIKIFIIFLGNPNSLHNHVIPEKNLLHNSQFQAIEVVHHSIPPGWYTFHSDDVINYSNLLTLTRFMNWSQINQPSTNRSSVIYQKINTDHINLMLLPNGHKEEIHTQNKPYRRRSRLVTLSKYPVHMSGSI